MAGENFAGAVNALYDRMDRNVNRNMENMDPYNLLKQQYALEGARRALQQDTDVRNALSGIQSMEDVPSAVPGLLRSGDVTGASNLLNAFGRTNYYTGREALNQAGLQEKLLKLGKEAIPFLRANPSAYPSVRQGLLQRGMNPELLPDPSSFGSDDELMSYFDQADEAIAGYSSRLNASTPSYHQIPSGEEQVTVRVTPGMGGAKEEVIATAPRHKPYKDTTTEDALKARKRISDIQRARVLLGKNNAMTAIVASLVGQPELAGQTLDDIDKKQLFQSWDDEITMLEPIAKGGGKGSETGKVAGNPLSGKPPGRYRINGQEVKWDGQKVIQ